MSMLAITGKRGCTWQLDVIAHKTLKICCPKTQFCMIVGDIVFVYSVENENNNSPSVATSELFIFLPSVHNSLRLIYSQLQQENCSILLHAGHMHNTLHIYHHTRHSPIW